MAIPIRESIGLDREQSCQLAFKLRGDPKDLRPPGPCHKSQLVFPCTSMPFQQILHLVLQPICVAHLKQPAGCASRKVDKLGQPGSGVAQTDASGYRAAC